MADRLSLIGIRGRGFHGVFDDERRNGQDFLVDVEFEIPSRIRIDDLRHTIDYSVVAQAVHDLITGEPVDLIETLAERIAVAVLDLGAQAVTVRVHKPQAPIPLPFDDVIVSIERTRITAVLSLGANLAEPVAALNLALAELQRLPGARVLAVSDVYATEPVSGIEQDDFANAVVVLQVDCTPEELLRATLQIEAHAGRRRTRLVDGPRVLDIDLIDVQDSSGPVRRASPMLTLPHPRAVGRGFVLIPWLQADPQACLTDAGPVADLVTALPVDHPAVRSAGITLGRAVEGP